MENFARDLSAAFGWKASSLSSIPMLFSSSCSSAQAGELGSGFFEAATCQYLALV